MQLRPKWNEYPKPLNPDRPDMVLGMGSLALEIYKTADGCDLQIRGPHGTARHAGSIMYRRAEFPGGNNVIEAIYFGRAVESSDEQIIHVVDELLQPPDPTEAHVVQRPDGSLYCTTCGQEVENTANSEMRKEGCFAHSHVCPGPRPKSVERTDDHA